MPKAPLLKEIHLVVLWTTCLRLGKRRYVMSNRIARGTNKGYSEIMEARRWKMESEEYMNRKSGKQRRRRS